MEEALEFLVSSLVKELNCTKIRLEITLNAPTDPCVAQTAPTRVTNGTQMEEMDPIGSHSVGKNRPMYARTLLATCNRGEQDLTLAGANHRGTGLTKCGIPVIDVVQATRCAVSQIKQGQWMRWEGTEKRKLAWRELWGMEAFQTSFITYDVLSSPSDLNHVAWFPLLILPA